ncbi:unnamed protein product [Trichobilharzia regenti]|nr:unnamed protein product [Trichobilharzia regenti]
MTVMQELNKDTCDREWRLSILDQELSQLIYAFATSHNVTECALKHLGYVFNAGNHILQDSGYPGNMTTKSTTVNNWPLWSGPHVFCLLSGHMLSKLRSTESIITSEDSIKSFWLCFLTSVQETILSLCDMSTIKSITLPEQQFMDIHPNLLQFACFLAGQSPGLTAKKQLLILLTQVLCSLNKKEDAMQNNRCFIWEYSSIASLLHTLHAYFLPLPLTTTPTMMKVQDYFSASSPIPFFYDLLIAAEKANDEQPVNLTPTAKRSSPSSSLPSPDGLAISSLVSVNNYHELFSSLLDYLDSLLLTNSFNEATNSVDCVLTECSQLPLCDYGLTLNWRLFEILPPPREILKDLQHLMNMLKTSQGIIDNNTVPEIFLSPSHLIYFIILLDRIQWNSTQPDYQYLGKYCSLS